MIADQNISYVELDPVAEPGYRILGHYDMHVPPRIAETVTIQGALGGEFRRYIVLDVIHHMPPCHDRSEGVSVTVVLRPVIEPSDIERAIRSVCLTGPIVASRESLNAPA